MRINEDKKKIRIGVRDFVSPVKDERWDLPVLPERLQLGTEVHQNYRASRSLDEGFQAEVSIKLCFEHRGYEFEIAGRMDGLYDLGQRLVVEEVKSLSLEGREMDLIRLEDFPSAVMQVSLYCYALEEERACPVEGRLIFSSVFDGVEEELDVPWSREGMQPFIYDRADDILNEHLRYLSWLEIRTKAAPRMRFPFETVRPIQEEMLGEVEQALQTGKAVLMEAPTGTGKTAVALYAALKHAYENDLRVVFVTAKTSGQRSAAELLERLKATGIPLSSITVSARAKVCLQTVVYCHAEHCSAADGYHQKCRQAAIVPQLCEQGLVGRTEVEEAGRDLDVCPFELSLDLAKKTDVVVCDYNYVFHPTVRIRRLFPDGKKQKLLLVVDEAHNLLDRARHYFSPSISGRLLEQAKAYGALRGGTFGRRIEALSMEMCLDLEQWAFDGGLEGVVDSRSEWEPDQAQLLAWQLEWAQLLTDDPHRRRYRPVPGEDDLLLDVYRKLSHMIRVLSKLSSDKILPHLHRTEQDVFAKVLCLDPSEQLQETFGLFEGSIAMSATLSPLEQMRDALGLPSSTALASFPSPFPPENRKIVVDPEISTRFKAREQQIPEMARRIFEYACVHGGRYAVFVPSYRFLKQLEHRLSNYEIDLLCDSPHLDDMLRQSLLKRLGESTEGAGLFRPAPVRILLSVLGGSFSEGIEWQSGVLDGVFVVGPGLPSVSFEQQQLRIYHDNLGGDGFEIAFINPGIRRVIQAAGRLIRRESDQGIICLMGERFQEKAYQQLLPRHWYDRDASELSSLGVVEELEAFWAGASRRESISREDAEQIPEE